MESSGRRILDVIIENSDRRLSTLLYNNEEYRRIGRELSRGFEMLEKEKLTKQQKRAVDDLFSVYNEESACCYRILYEQGFKDCICLLKEIGIV